MNKDTVANRHKGKMKQRGIPFGSSLSPFQRALLKQKHRDVNLSWHQFLKECEAFDLQRIPVERTAQRYIKEFNEELAREDYDKFVDWDDLETILAPYDIYNPDENKSKSWRVNREHLDRLREVESWAMRHLNKLVVELRAGWKSDSTVLRTFNPRTTYRSLKWQDYFLTYTPKLGADHYIKQPMDIWVIGELFTNREMDAEAYKESIDIDCLKAWLVHKPFDDYLKNLYVGDSVLTHEINKRHFYMKSGENVERYVMAIKDGLIPKLKASENNYSVNSLIALTFMSLDHIEDRTVKSTNLTEMSHRLPSIQFDDLIRHGINPEIAIIDPVTKHRVTFHWNLPKEDRVPEEEVTNEPFSYNEEYSGNGKDVELFAELSEKTHQITKLEDENTALRGRIFELTEGGEGESDDIVTNEPFIAPP